MLIKSQGANPPPHKGGNTSECLFTISKAKMLLTHYQHLRSLQTSSTPTAKPPQIDNTLGEIFTNSLFDVKVKELRVYKSFWWKHKSQCVQKSQEMPKMLSQMPKPKMSKLRKIIVNAFENATSALLTTIFTNSLTSIGSWTIWWSSAKYMPNSDQCCGNCFVFGQTLVWLSSSCSVAEQFAEVSCHFICPWSFADCFAED